MSNFYHARTLAARAVILFLLLCATPFSVAADFIIEGSDLDSNEWMGRTDSFSITLNKLPEADEGRIAVLINGDDYTSMFQRDGRKLVYAADEPIPLPSGEGELVVYLVRDADNWEEIGSVPIKVLNRFGLERGEIAPRLEASLESTWDDGQSEDAGEPERNSDFHDLGFQAGASGEAIWGGNEVRGDFNIVGTTFQEKALQFSTEADEADKVDLSNFIVEYARGGGKLQWGHVSHGDNRYLVDNISRRGAHASYEHNQLFDVSAAYVSGREIVGWDNISGINDSDDAIFGATLGVNLLNFFYSEDDLNSGQPLPGVRAEFSYLDGKNSNESDFETGQVNDVEESSGFGFKLLATDLPLGFSAGYTFARSKYTNPEDPDLDQGFDVVQVQETTDNASFVEVGWDMLQGGYELSNGRFITLNVDGSFEEVDPEFKSLAAFPTSNQRIWNVVASANVLGLIIDGQHLKNRDNLDHLSNILSTESENTSFALAAPIASLISPENAASMWYVPELTYNYNHTKQFANDAVLNDPTSGFTEASQIPDQTTNAHNVGLNFATEYVDFGYAFNYSFENNKQIGRELADFKTYFNSINLLIRPGVDWLTLNAGVGHTRQNDREQQLTNETQVVDLGFDLLLPYDISVTNGFSFTKDDDSQELRERTAYTYLAQVSYQMQLPTIYGTPGALSLFVKYDYQDDDSQDNEFAFDSVVRSWAVTSGVTASLF